MRRATLAAIASAFLFTAAPATIIFLYAKPAAACGECDEQPVTKTQVKKKKKPAIDWALVRKCKNFRWQLDGYESDVMGHSGRLKELQKELHGKKTKLAELRRDIRMQQASKRRLEGLIKRLKTTTDPELAKQVRKATRQLARRKWEIENDQKTERVLLGNIKWINGEMEKVRGKLRDARTGVRIGKADYQRNKCGQVLKFLE